MSVFTSSSFASICVSGTGWRDTAKKALEALEAVRTEGQGFNIGFLYVSDALAHDAGSILTLFKSVTGIENWVGCTGLGVCGVGEEFIDQPAISALVGNIDEDAFTIFHPVDGSLDEVQKGLKPWLDNHDPMLVCVHGDPMAEYDPIQTLESLQSAIGGFMVGGMSSSRSEHYQFADDLHQGGLSGAVFSSTVPVASSLSQGCAPLGSVHTITNCDDHIIYELDGQKAADVFTKNIRDLAYSKTGMDPDKIMLEGDDVEDIPNEFKDVLNGEIHVAFPVSGSDTQDYLVRNILGMDPEEGSIAVSQLVQNGDHMMFVHRDDETVKSDLSSRLVKLRARVIKDKGVFEPKGAIYVSCVARAFSSFGHEKTGGEMALIREVIGDVPLAGFYANGEISNANLYGYTGVLTLFL